MYICIYLYIYVASPSGGASDPLLSLGHVGELGDLWGLGDLGVSPSTALTLQRAPQGLSGCVYGSIDA